MDEPFGPEYVRPAQTDCPRCGCCTEKLCERGRYSVMQCAGHAPAEFHDTVRGCPCSAETTAHTAAWRAAQVRVTRLARELPLASEAVALLRALAAGEEAQDPDGLAGRLKARGLVQYIDLLPVVTGLGRTYLSAVDDVRGPTVIRVLDVDQTSRTARVEVDAWRQDEPVTVLLDQITTDTGLEAGSLPGRMLEADANCSAVDADHLVMTGYRELGPLPSGWMGVGGEDE